MRRRFDGERRNPWDEPECGHHYARAMSAWSGVLALSGFRYHAVEKSVVAVPRLRVTPFASFWSAGPGWGKFSVAVQNGRTRLNLMVSEGTLPVRKLTVAGKPAAKSTLTLAGKEMRHQISADAAGVTATLTDEIVVRPGAELVLVS